MYQIELKISQPCDDDIFHFDTFSKYSQVSIKSHKNPDFQGQKLISSSKYPMCKIIDFRIYIKT